MVGMDGMGAADLGFGIVYVYCLYVFNWNFAPVSSTLPVTDDNNLLESRHI